MRADEVLAAVNAAHGTSWILGPQLAGGYQGGAFQLADPSGVTAVLKWSENERWAPTVLAAARLVEHARAHGWPTPRWLAVGLTPDSRAYHVQERMPGAPLRPLDMAALKAALHAIERQADLSPATEREWSAYCRAVVFEDPGDLMRLVARASPNCAAFVARVQSWNRGNEHRLLPTNDLVHGDMNLDNILFDGGDLIAFVDVEAVARGTRVCDLSRLLLETDAEEQPEVSGALVTEALRLAELEVLKICFSANALELLGFMVEHNPGGTDGAAAAMMRLTHFVDELI